MKKLLNLLLVPALCLSMFAASASATTQAVSCDDVNISNTGPGSSNEILCSTNNTVKVRCASGTVVDININQNSNSGDATNDGNTNGGGANSGTANNSSVTNAQINSACGTTTQTTVDPPTPSTPVTPTASVVPQPVAPAQTPQKITSLPNTGAITPLTKISLALLSLVAFAVVSKIGLSIYSKSTS